jgi:glycosyltransferase involved in cell wall biosynthesis
LGRELRVLAVTNMYPTEGNPTYGGFVATQMNAIAQAGVRVDVDFVNGRRSDWEYAKGLERVRRAARSGKFDVVHAHYGLCGFICSFQPLPLVISYWGDDLLGSPNGSGGITAKSRLILGISFAAAYRADAINCESEEMRSRLPHSIDRARTHVIPNGVDTSLFCPGSREAARQRLGLDPSEKLVLFPNTPTERRKRLDLAEAAIRLLEGQGIRARLWIVQRVPPRDMPDYFRAADCLLLTSDWEGSPNVVKEAICCDVPVVSVDAGDVRWLLGLTPGSVLVERDPTAIAHGLREVMTGPGRVSGQRVREELAIERLAARIIGVYDDAIVRRVNRNQPRRLSTT